MDIILYENYIQRDYSIQSIDQSDQVCNRKNIASIDVSN